MEAVKSGHTFSSTCLTKIDTKLILFSDVMGGTAGMHKHNSLQGMRPRCLGTCHLFLAVTWWACSEAWLECGPAVGVKGCVCAWGQRGAAGFRSSTFRPPAPPTPGTCCTERVHAESTLGLSTVWKCTQHLNFLQEAQGSGGCLV